MQQCRQQQEPTEASQAFTPNRRRNPRRSGEEDVNATELHKTCSPLFSPAITEEQRAPIIERLSARLDALEQRFSTGGYLMGSDFCVADLYLFVVTGWFGRLNISLKKWPHIERFREVMATRPAVQAALEAEGLL